MRLNNVKLIINSPENYSIFFTFMKFPPILKGGIYARKELECYAL